MIGINHRNIYKNKSINQLLSVRLQLPEAKASDTLVTHSIAQNAANSNTEMIWQTNKNGSPPGLHKNSMMKNPAAGT